MRKAYPSHDAVMGVHRIKSQWFVLIFANAICELDAQPRVAHKDTFLKSWLPSSIKVALGKKCLSFFFKDFFDNL